MCTVTIIPLHAGGFRLVTNRDESRTRPGAEPPAVRELAGGIVAAWPRDPVGGGTWIAVTSRAVALTMLNCNPDPAPPRPPNALSRGLIVPALAPSDSPAEAEERLGAMDLARFAPFRLVVCDSAGVLEAQWDGSSLVSRPHALAPVCFASSGLGDRHVQCRIPLWESLIARSGAVPRVQDEFHRHAWPDRPQWSVLMSRAEARTVSTTVVEAGDGTPARMHYRDDDGEHAADLGAGAPAPREAWPC